MKDERVACEIFTLPLLMSKKLEMGSELRRGEESALYRATDNHCQTHNHNYTS